MNVVKKERFEVFEGYNWLLLKWYLKDCLGVFIFFFNGFGLKVIL